MALLHFACRGNSRGLFGVFQSLFSKSSARLKTAKHHSKCQVNQSKSSEALSAYPKTAYFFNWHFFDWHMWARPYHAEANPNTSELKVAATEGSQNKKRPKVSMCVGILKFSGGETLWFAGQSFCVNTFLPKSWRGGPMLNKSNIVDYNLLQERDVALILF